ncbi:MAG: winged helix-turn-helix transcriptional regulator, partial [Thermoleophilaceae bacterium]
NQARSGAQTLELLASPINCAALEALAGGPKQQTELRRAAGSPAQSTLRGQLARLNAMGAIQKQHQNRFPGAVEHELTDAGRELLEVAGALGRWLGRRPEDPPALGSSKAKAAIKALAEGWNTAMLRVLAAEPLTLTRLDRVVKSLNYPSLERRLTAMRLAGLAEATEGDGRGTPYRVTPWAREAVAPLLAASQWERRRRPDESNGIGKVDVETVFLLAMPLLRLPEGLSGACRMTVATASGGNDALAGVLVDARAGRVTACTTRLQGDPAAWASGNPAAWLAAILEADIDLLEIGGDRALARTLLDALRDALFGAPARRASRRPPP